MDPLSQGREYYVNRDYKAALDTFTQIIRASTDNIRLIALDHRAATFEKLGELQSALKDARDMIVMKPARAKGYLRCGKVLQLTGKESLALQIFERGLSKVKIGDDTDRPLLQQNYTKLQQRQKPSRNLDPLVALPNEIALMIFHYLRIRDLVICLAVSRSWKRFLDSSHGLWTTLDLCSSRRDVRKDALKAYLRRSNYGVNKAYLNVPLSFLSGGKLDMITGTCKKLKHLECRNSINPGDLGRSLLSALPQATGLRTLIIKDYRMLISLIAHALSICPLLEHVEFHRVELAESSLPIHWPQLGNLSSLLFKSINRRNIDGTINLDKLITSTPNLRSLTLGYDVINNPIINWVRVMDLTQWNKLEHFELFNANILKLPIFSPTLKYLDMSQLYQNPFPIEREKYDLPLLETLVFEDNSGFDLMFCSQIVQSSIKNGNLRTLRLSNQCPLRFGTYDKEALATFASPDLVELSLKFWRITEDQLLEFLRLFPALKYLDLSMTNVTGVAIRELLTRESGPLEWLGLNECSKLSLDAVDYARYLGCTVDCSSGQTYKIKSVRDRMAMSGL